jgi:Flp pilus assembly protein TadG
MKTANRLRRRQKGHVLVIMATASFALLGGVGLALDVGRLLIAKQETQNYVDAAALAAALELDGTSAGITRARTAVTASGNTWNMNTSTISNAQVDFATNIDGPWAANPSSATGYTYARVRLTVPGALYFMPAITRTYSQNVISTAIANQVALTNLSRGLTPFTAIAQTNAGPNFGLVRGIQYTIQWPQDKGADDPGACKTTNPDKCFVKDPCPGDSDQVVWNVHQYWGQNMNGYWGFSNTSDMTQSILDGKQTGPISVGQDLDSRGGGNIEGVQLYNGNKAAIAPVLDQRAAQDDYNGSNDVTDYLAHADHNGRRLLAVPVVDVVSDTQSIVRGFGLFMLISNGNSSNYYQRQVNGNDPFCAIYVGPYNIGSNDSGGSTSGTGAYHVTLVR